MLAEEYQIQLDNLQSHLQPFRAEHSNFTGHNLRHEGLYEVDVFNSYLDSDYEGISLPKSESNRLPAIPLAKPI